MLLHLILFHPDLVADRLRHRPPRDPSHPAGRSTRRGELGEGVISAAIAVLIMAFLGAAMWLAFKGLFDGTSARTSTQVELIGR